MQHRLQSPAPKRRHAEWKLQWSATQGNLKTISGVDAGYNVATTKAVTPINLIISADWALLSFANTDGGRLINLASRALDEKTIIGKSITERYYTLAAAYAYWMGCSQRRRQGPMTAQRYPDNCNGIMVIALAVNWGQLFTGLHWVHQVMHELDYYPRPFEVKASMSAAVDACDGLDGTVDGVVGSHECHLNPFALAGQFFDCNGTNTAFTANGASVMKAARKGAALDR